MKTRRADLGLIGFGSVGRRFATLLAERQEQLANGHGLECRIVCTATRQHLVRADSARDQIAPEARPAYSGEPDRHGSAALQLIEQLRHSDADLRVVVETTTLDVASGQPAIDHVRAALDAGCHVITANKGPVAFAYAELRDRAAAAALHFRFEGAVMDGVPIFSLVRETLPAIEIHGFRGVVNSTTNHVLTALEKGEPFDAAVARMQAEGIAEADPSLDIDGWDAAAKASALANVLLDARMTPHMVARTGIGPSDGGRALLALARGKRLKLVASAARTNGTVVARVEPLELPASDLLATLDGKANALVLQTDLLGDIGIVQLEGSLTHTAYALLSDLLAVARCPAPHAMRARQIL